MPSINSNALIRFGADMHALHNSKENRLYEAPTLFQYAKKAGYSTQYLDTQVLKDTLNDYMSFTEANQIDVMNQKVKDSVTIDQDMLPLMTDNIKKNRKNFVIYKKIGAHNAYKSRYPENKNIFKCDGCLPLETYIAQYKNAIS